MSGDGELRGALAVRLRARRQEIEKAILARVGSVSDPPEALGSEYASALRSAVGTAVEYGLLTVELGTEDAPPPPPELLAQARLAARRGVGLDTVLRRYFAGFALLGDFLLQEAERGFASRPTVAQEMLKDLSVLLDRLVLDVAVEHSRAGRENPASTDVRRAELVKRLLAGGDPGDASGLSYELEAHHIAVIACGEGSDEAIRGLAKPLDVRLLLIPWGEQTVWAWFGSIRLRDPGRIAKQVREQCFERLTIALGEPGRGLDGWRLSHHQAKAALPIALGRSERVVRYSDVAILASIMQDELLLTSLRQLYLAPLANERDGGKILRQTLHAYLDAERNASSAAAALGVSRRTVTNRLAVIEDRLGCSVTARAAELEAVMRAEELESYAIVPSVVPKGR